VIPFGRKLRRNFSEALPLVPAELFYHYSVSKTSVGSDYHCGGEWDITLGYQWMPVGKKI
jgi:hypothetical protein